MPHEIVKLPSIKSNLSELSRENVLRIQLTCVDKSIWLVKNDHEIQAYASTSTHTLHTHFTSANASMSAGCLYRVCILWNSSCLCYI